VIYFYVLSYVRLYNAYNTCYQEGITYRFANWPFSCRSGPNTTQNTCRAMPCRSSCRDPRHGTALAFVSCRHGPKFIVSCRASDRAKMSCFMPPIHITASPSFRLACGRLLVRPACSKKKSIYDIAASPSQSPR
jgi:hypothetical protein